MTPHDPTEECLPTEEYATISRAAPRTYQIAYMNVLFLSYFHVAGFYGFYLGYKSAMWQTLIFSYITYWLSIAGIVAGAHRLWSHRSFKATQPLQVFLMLCHSLSSQYTVIHWARDHRLHHKFSDTDADPHNANRGLFYSHIGWLMVKKHPAVREKGKTIDVSDLTSNPVLSFQYRNSYWFIPLIGFLLPTLIPLLWGEILNVSWHLNMTRYIIVINVSAMINSIAHAWGNKPFDKAIRPAQHTVLSILTQGEGYHNFHHVFPCDYRSDEFSSIFNTVALFIEGCQALGLAYDLKTVPKKVIAARIQRTGDGSHPRAKY